MNSDGFVSLAEAERLARQQSAPPPADDGPPPWEPEPEPPVRTLPVLRYEDIEATIGTADFVEGLLIDGGLSLVFGASNSGKTFLVTDLGLHVAMGWPWYGREVEAGGVLYCAAEGGSGIRNRIAAFQMHHGAAAAGDMVPFAVIPATIDLCNPSADTAALIATIKATDEAFGVPVRLVIIDTVSRAMAGGDENASADMGALVRNLDRIRQETGVHVLAVHHSGKNATQGARGHSLLRAAVDTEIEVTRDEETGTSAAKVTKQRDLPVAGELTFRLEVAELGTNRRGKPVTSCVVVAANSSAKPRSEKLSDSQRRAFEQLQNCLADSGKIYRDKRDIPSVPVVALEEWRERLRRAGETDRDNSNNERSQWSRIQKALKDKGVIRSWDGLVWIARQTETERDETDVSQAGRARHETPPTEGGLGVSSRPSHRPAEPTVSDEVHPDTGNWELT